jgi:hypothetical protein
LKATTPSFEHVSVVWGGVTCNHWLANTSLIQPEEKREGSDAHVKGLRYLLEFFRRYEEVFDGFLFLDSDAFPIRVGWLDMLLAKLESTPAFYEDGTFIPTLQTASKEYEVAMPIRAENLETRYHASVLYATKLALPHLSFEHNVYGPDMLGTQERDICVPEYQVNRRDKVWPLLRSNQHNVHPLACGVYYDMFYHHCCGSGRATWFRSGDYWDVLGLADEDFTDRLMKDPTAFVGRLAGWSPDKYALLGGAS